MPLEYFVYQLTVLGQLLQPVQHFPIGALHRFVHLGQTAHAHVIHELLFLRLRGRLPCRIIARVADIPAGLGPGIAQVFLLHIHRQPVQHLAQSLVQAFYLGLRPQQKQYIHRQEQTCYQQIDLPAFLGGFPFPHPARHAPVPVAAFVISAFVHAFSSVRHSLFRLPFRSMYGPRLSGPLYNTRIAQLCYILSP